MTETDPMGSGFPMDIVLTPDDNWQSVQNNLLAQVVQGNTTINYSYYLEEVSTQNPSETTIIYKDTNGNVINAPSAAETSQSGTQEIINRVPTGYLQINKSVTWNGEDPTTAAQKSALAGDYKFKVYTDENCSKPYKVKQGNQVVDLELTVTIGEDGTAQSSDKVKLPLGDYWIEEQTPSQNGVTPEAGKKYQFSAKVDATADTGDLPHFFNYACKQSLTALLHNRSVKYPGQWFLPWYAPVPPHR